MSVPVDGSVLYRNIKKFSPEVYNQIDIRYFYRLSSIYESDQKFQPKTNYRADHKDYTSLIQFYKNGRVRFFPKGNIPQDPNPEFSGLRGVIYMSNGNIKMDQTSMEEPIIGGRSFSGTNSYKIKVEGDKLYILEQRSFMLWIFHYSVHLLLQPPIDLRCFVYEKAEKIPDEWLQYEANW